MHLSSRLKLSVFFLVFSANTTADDLTDIYTLALQNDARLRAAKAAYLANREAKNINRGALLPNLVATGQFTDTDDDTDSTPSMFSTSSTPSTPPNVPQDDIFPNPPRTTETDSESYSVSLNQAIFDLPAWFEFRSGVKISKQARAEFSAAQQEQITRVASAYFDVLRANENLESAVAEQAAIARQLEQTRERFEVGLLPITDVHEAQAVFDNARVNTLEAQSALDIAFEALQVLTGQRHLSLSGLKGDFPINRPVPEVAEDWVNFSLTNNFLLSAASFAAEAASHTARARKFEHLPRVSGSAAYNKTHSDSNIDGTDRSTNKLLSRSFFSDTEANSIAIQVEMPLFTGGVTSALRRQAQQQAVQAKENLVATRRATVQEARSRHLRLLTDVARVAARKQAITSAESALEATRAGYDVGTRNIVDVLVAQRTLYQARRDYARARYDYIGSMLALKETAGQLSPDDLYNLNAWLDPEISVVRSAAAVAR